MAETFTPRFGLIQWGAPGDGPSRAEFNAALANIETKAVLFVADVLANRPGAGVVSRVFVATDVGRLFWDTGAAWLEFALVGSEWTVPTGALLPMGMSAVPTGFLAADGSAVSRTTFAALFARYGTTWGAGDGATTFNLPDSRDRTPVGSGNIHALGGIFNDTHQHNVAFNSSDVSAGHTHGIVGNSENLSGLQTGLEAVIHTHGGVVFGNQVSGGNAPAHTHSAGHSHGPGSYGTGGHSNGHVHGVNGATQGAAAVTTFAARFMVKT
jgi:microcystin-dependent protein